LGVLAIVAVCLKLAESGLTRLVARSVPVGRLRRSLLALLTVLAYILIAGLAFSLVWDGLEDAGHWGTQSARLAESAVSFGMFLAFVLGLGRSLLANGRSSWRLPPISDDLARQLAPLPWLFAFVAAVAWLPMTLNEVLDGPLNGVISDLAPPSPLPSPASSVSPCFGIRPGRRTTKRSRRMPPDSLTAACRRPLRLGLLIGLTTALMVALLVLVAVGYLALARVIAGQATWAGIVPGVGLLALQVGRRLVDGAALLARQLQRAAAQGAGRGAAAARPNGGGAVGSESHPDLLLHGDRVCRATGQQPRAVAPAQRQVRVGREDRRVRSPCRAPSSASSRC
jgi:hypothetical protein